MDRFKILKDVDPFADRPQGDPCKYTLMGTKYRGWRIDDTNLILDMNESTLKFIAVLKDARVEIQYDTGKAETFCIKSIFNKILYKDGKKRNRLKVHFIGHLPTII